MRKVVIKISQGSRRVVNEYSRRVVGKDRIAASPPNDLARWIASTNQLAECCCCPCGPGQSIGCLGGPDDASSLDQEGVREPSDMSKDNVPATRDEVQYWAEARE